MRPLAALLALALAGCAATAEEPKPPPLPPVADDAIPQALLKEINALAEAGKTRKGADLLAEKREGLPEVKLAEPAKEELRGPALYRRLRESTVIVGSRYKCKKCTNWHANAASGFVIGADGVIVTNHHVIASPDKEEMGVMDAEGRVYGVERLLADDPVHDVAVLKIAATGLKPLPLAVERPEPGSDVAVLSHPNSKFWVFTLGNVSRIQEWVNPHGMPAGRYPVLCITASFAPGSSGAPVTDRAGNVVGIATRITPVLQAKEGDAHKEGAGEYTAMIIPTAVPVEWVRALVTAGK